MNQYSGERLTTSEVADRLGVKPATVYAYVSRGLLRSRRGADGRTSLFDAADVERLARGARRRPQGASSGVIGSSQVSTINDGVLRYRGLPVEELAARRSFEEVAKLLWSGTLGAPGAWTANDRTVAVARAMQRELPAATLPLERLQVIVPAAAALDPLRHDLRPASVHVAGQTLIATMVEALPALPAGPPPAGLAARLWSRLTGDEPRAALVRVLEAAMTVMADHELAVSTQAVRIAASAGSDPYSAVGAGLAAASGALHGGASLAVEGLLADIPQARDAAEHLGQRLRRGDHVIGFGHPMYPQGDPRARLLLELLSDVPRGRGRWATVNALLSAVAARGWPPPNVDFALAAFSYVAGLRRGSGEAIFGIARTAGWLAHALEQYGQDRLIEQP